MSEFSILGTFMHSPLRGSAEVLTNTLLDVDPRGVISAVSTDKGKDFTARCSAADDAGHLVRTQPGQYLLPGFVDTHIHAPQWPQLGKALHLPLEQWLMANTFPLEARYADLDFAARMYRSLVNNLVANGTTTAVYFATIHQAASRLLADLCLAKGQRAFVGKVAMDDPSQCPEYYRDASAAAAVAGSREFIEYVTTMPGNERNRIMPIITPRFIPSCTDDLLNGLGELARDTGCPVQTHCSESDWEHQYVIDRCGTSDTTSLDQFGLLTARTVLAHGNLINDSDMALITTRGAGVAHCPLSNGYFSNSAFPLRAALEKGVNVGLGTDISGGPSASMFDSCRQAVTTSRMLDDGIDPALPAQTRGRANSRIDFRDAFWLATRGGAKMLNIPVGCFVPGMEFDAMLIDTAVASSSVHVFDDLDSHEDIMQKIIYGASRINIRKVWIAGQVSHHNESEKRA